MTQQQQQQQQQEQGQEQHTLSQCPFRSSAFLILKEQDNKTVLSVSDELKRLLGYDCTNQSIDTVWKKATTMTKRDDMVTTLVSQKTLSTCVHDQMIVCMDMTDLEKLYINNANTTTTNTKAMSIIRLTMYGTIDAAFLNDNDSKKWIGQPVMRFVHNQDMERLCAGLSRATQLGFTTFQVRLEIVQDQYESAQFTVVAIEGGQQLLCLIEPGNKYTPYYLEEEIEEEEALLGEEDDDDTLSSISSSSSSLASSSHCCMLQESVTTMQRQFWHALERGMTSLARSVAVSLVMLVQTLIDFWHMWREPHTTTELLIKQLVNDAKKRPELSKVCHLLSWTGIPEASCRYWLEGTLDQTSEWFISKTIRLTR